MFLNQYATGKISQACYMRYRNIVSVGKSVCIKAGKDPHIFLLFTSMCSSKDCTYIINILCNRPLGVSLG